MGLGEDGGGGGVGLEEADAVVLVEQEVEVAGGVGLDGVELALVRDGAEAGEGEARGLGAQRQAGYYEQEEEECAMGVRPGARLTYFHHGSGCG